MTGADRARARFALEIRTGTPPEPGHYVAWLEPLRTPVVLYWHAQSTGWMKGYRFVDVAFYAGPLPKAKR